MSKQIRKTWLFRSTSSNSIYETLQYNDASTSCNCPGWTRRTDINGNRCCKHTRLVDMGHADSQAASNHDYGIPLATAAPQPTQTPSKTKSKKTNTPDPVAPQPGLGKRKLLLD